jgi:drug/metabolite transporter (DMT)-like permease
MSTVSARTETRGRLVGIALICAALLCFAMLDATAKWLNRTVDPLLTVWARYAVSVVLVGLFANPWTKPGVLRTSRPGLQIGRSILLFLSTAANFVALQYLQLAETLSILFAAPLIVALLAGPLLGERAGTERLIAIAVGFIGVLVVTRPGFGTHPAIFLSMAGTLCYAGYALLTRKLAAHDSSETTLVYSGLAGFIVMMPILPMVWTQPDALTTFLLLMTGFYGAFGHWLLILAHARAPAPVLAPFIYTQMIWMLILGYVVFGDWPTAPTLVGAGIVICSGLYLLSRERFTPRKI